MFKAWFIYKSEKFIKYRINCKEATRLLSEQLEHPLPLYKRALLKLHLSVCDACVHFGKQIKALRNLLRKKSLSKENSMSSSHTGLSDEALGRIKEKIRKEASERT